MARRKVGDIFTYDLSETEFDYIDIGNLGDIHLGHDDFDLKALKKFIAWVQGAPNRFVIGIGDYIECVTSGRNPGTSLTTQAININGQVDVLIKLLDPIKDRIICMAEGNHEQRIVKDTQFDIMRHAITPRLDTYYLGYQGWLRVKLGNYNYYIYIHHGPERSSSENPKFHLDKVALKLGYASQADAILMGHNHKLFAHKYSVPIVSGDKIYTHDCWAIRTGGYLNYPLYSRASLYRPADVGSPIMRLFRTKRNIDVYHDVEMYESIHG